MFKFFNKKQKAEVDNKLPFTTDMHSHILPGIDDGSPDVETSIQLIRGLMDLGITKSIATPHIIGDMYRNTPDTIFAAQKLLQDELDDRQIDFQLSAAAEYMLDNYFFEMLSNKSLLLTVKDNLLLTEFSFSSMPDHIEKMAFSIITEGYVPILAHPERYGYFHGNQKIFQRLKDLGFLLQVNILSLTGYYGKEIQKTALYLVKNDLVSFIGTDLHHERHLEAMNVRLIGEVLGEREWNVSLRG